MPVGIRIFKDVRQQPGQACYHTEYGKDMRAALENALRWAKYHELAVAPSDTPVDRTLYLYDCLGGLRAEVRRRGHKITIKRT